MVCSGLSGWRVHMYRSVLSELNPYIRPRAASQKVERTQSKKKWL